MKLIITRKVCTKPRFESEGVWKGNKFYGGQLENQMVHSAIILNL